MKKIIAVLLCTCVLSGCRNAEERNRQKATDLITARTLGLGYLEEFKLGEAEAEFLKF
ncbi:MAG: hypothetical protein IQL11_02925, partial [Bacteroidales bacterium]|nr:hypothetical protein [Bacteroidales bacterium]